MKILEVSELVTRPVPRNTKVPWLKEDSNKVEVYKDVFVKLEYKGKLIKIVVPKGYISDWSSIPRAVWWFYPPNFSEARKAAIFHDYIYSHVHWYFSKKFADLLFKEMMLLEGASKSDAFVFHNAVRFGGRGGWTYKKKDDSHIHWKTVHGTIPTIEDL